MHGLALAPSLALVALAGTVAPTAAAAAAAPAAKPAPVTKPSPTPRNVYLRPASGVYTVSGHGWGHGHGMSQWGAQGAASLGKRYPAILAAYYPGTTLTTVPASTRLRVELTKAGSHLQVRSAPGLALANGKHTAVLPRAVGGRAITAWRLRPNGASMDLDYYTGGWHPATFWGAHTLAGTVVFRNASAPVRVALPDRTDREYRGDVRSVLSGARRYTVNVVRLEDYLRSVISVEMSPSWRPEALRSQAVAARTYAMYKRARAAAKPYDICDTTSCQVYAGVRAYNASGHLVRTYEDPRTDSAVAGSAGRVLTYGGGYAFTEFSASNGGYSTAGDLPYLKANPDPWDGQVPNPSHSWKDTFTTRQVEQAWPSIRPLTKITVLKRDGNGEWGGRILRLRLDGPAASVEVSAATFVARVGVRSRWWTVTG